MRRALGVAAVTCVAALAAAAVLPEAADAASVKPSKTRAAYYAQEVSIPLKWRTNYAGCSNPQRFILNVTPRKSLRAPKRITARRKRPVLTARVRITGNIRKATTARWRVTLVCGNRRVKSPPRTFKLLPVGPEINGTYSFSGQLAQFGSWNAFKSDCAQGCESNIEIGDDGDLLVLRGDVNRTNVRYRVQHLTDGFTCTGPGGTVFKGNSPRWTFQPLVVIATEVENGKTFAKRVRVRGTVESQLNSFAQRAGCPAPSFAFNSIGVRA